jgi:hypothetical protein
MEKKPVQILIQYRDDEPVIQFAAQELQKYLAQMDPLAGFLLSPEISHLGEGISLGLFEDFNQPVPEVTDPAMDDCLHISVSRGQGIIAGLNPRAVLLGVYRFLEEAGCRFIRPGKDGEIIPRRKLEEITVSLQSVPSYRHRGLCIEGAVSLEHMLDNVDWAAKVGLNSYFLEFMNPYTFFERWYSHTHNPFLPPELCTPEQTQAFMRQIEGEIARRGLAYHNPGHGWTCESLGIPGLGWFSSAFELSDETRALLAQVDGKRELHKGVALNTHLCYSNPRARQAIVNYSVQYVKDHPTIRFLHVWLADSMNNMCECGACRDSIPADLYLVLLNEMDAAFSQAGLDTKIVFIAYVDLLWPPKVQRFANPERFVLIFAPISRTYSQTYDLDLEGVTYPPYQLNKNVLPSSIRQNLAFLRDWQKVFQGDSFTYEYYFMWDSYLDPGYYVTARILHEDIRHLHEVGLNGIMSDQSQRTFFPTAFGMHVMARMLWDDSLPFDDLARWYFTSDFGEENGESVRAYLARLSELFDPPYLRGDRAPRDEALHIWVLEGGASVADETAQANLLQVKEWIGAFRPTITKNLADSDPARARSWDILNQHADFCLLLAEALLERARGNQEGARTSWMRAKEFAQKAEADLHPVWDVFELISVFEHRFKLL